MFPDIDVAVPMPAGTAVPPQFAIAVGPLNVAVLLADAAGKAVDVIPVHGEMTCVLRTMDMATIPYDVEIKVTSGGGLAPADQAPGVATFQVHPLIVHIAKLFVTAREIGTGTIGFAVRYRPSGFPTWSAWSFAGPITVEIR